MSFRPRAIATLVALISMFAILPAASATAAVTPSTTPPASVNLADYALVARHTLPSALNPLGGDTSCASSGSGDVLGDEASAVAYDPAGNSGAGSLFILRKRKMGEDRPIYRMKGYPWIPGFFIHAPLTLGCHARSFCASAGLRWKRTWRRFSTSICPAPK